MRNTTVEKHKNSASSPYPTKSKTRQNKKTTLESDIDLQTWFKVLCGWAAENNPELHPSDIHRAVWIRQRSRELSCENKPFLLNIKWGHGNLLLCNNNNDALIRYLSSHGSQWNPAKKNNIWFGWEVEVTHPKIPYWMKISLSKIFFNMIMSWKSWLFRCNKLQSNLNCPF